MNKELRNQQKGSLKRLKRNAPEVQKCSRRQSDPEVVTSSEAEVHQKQPHQKLKITRSCSSSEVARLNASKAV
jgi:hypothetical protein